MCFRAELGERLRKFSLELHADKTRLIEFGRFAAERCARKGRGKPETFKFLGFTHMGRCLRGVAARSGCTFLPAPAERLSIAIVLELLLFLESQGGDALPGALRHGKLSALTGVPMPPPETRVIRRRLVRRGGAGKG